MAADATGQDERRRGAFWRRVVVVALLAVVAYSVWKLPLIIALHAQARWERDFGPTADFVHIHAVQDTNEAALGLRGALAALDVDSQFEVDLVVIIASAKDGASRSPSKLSSALERFEARAPQVDALVSAVLSASPLVVAEDPLGKPKILMGPVGDGTRACIARALVQSRRGEQGAAQRSLEAAWVLTEPWLKRADALVELGRWNLLSECRVLCACDQAWPGWGRRLASCALGPDVITILRARSVQSLAGIRSGGGSWQSALSEALLAEQEHDSAMMLSSWDACAADPWFVPFIVRTRYWRPIGTHLMGISPVRDADDRTAIAVAVALTRRVLALRDSRQAISSGGVPSGSAPEPPPDLPCPAAHFNEAQLPDGSTQVDVQDLPPWIENGLRLYWRGAWPDGVPVCSEPTDSR